MKINVMIRLMAILTLLALGLCGCNVKEEPTETPSEVETPTETQKPTSRPTAKPTSKPTSKPTEKQTQETTAKKRVAITFDDGPDDLNTKLLVDALDSYGFNSTFFVVGKKLDGTKLDGSEILKYAVEKGNEIGIHAYSNSTPYGDTCSDEVYEEEISKTEKAIHDILPDYEIDLMRPVQGKITDQRVADSEYAVILWSIDTYDWKYNGRATEEEKEANIKTIVDKVLNNVKDGDIILMHDVHDNSYEAALILFEELYLRGYELVTVSELIGDDLEAGKKFRRAE